MRATQWLLGSGLIALSAFGSAVALREHSGSASGATTTVASIPVRPVPVTTGIVEVKDFPIFRAGLGTVQAFNTVTVRARVDGEIHKIAFREGQDVRMGDLLAQIDPRPYEAQLHQAEADKARDEALLANAKLDLDRYSNLVVKEFATRQSVDTQKALVAQYQAAVGHDQAVIDNARVQLGYTTITSPLTGRLGIRLIDQGNIVHASDSSGLVVVTQLTPISLVFTLPQQYLPAIVEAMRDRSLLVEAYDQDNRMRLGEGRLELIDNEIDQGTGSLRLKAIFPNEDQRLWPGEFVNAWLQLGIRRGMVIPQSVVQAGPDGDYAFLVRPDASVEMHALRVGAMHDGQALIDAGLLPGDRVVVDGQYKLRPGVQVTWAELPHAAGDKSASVTPTDQVP
jgi:membrane fusion protein, multidrug efflux system